MGIDPANSAQWGYHLWLLRCAAAHTRGPDQGSCTTRVQKILEDSKLQCEQIVAGESARMATLRGRNVQNSLSVEAGECTLEQEHWKLFLCGCLYCCDSLLLVIPCCSDVTHCP